MKHLVPYAPSVPGTLVNGDFSQPILNRGFDWRAAAPGCATVAQTHTDGAALELFLSASRPESCEIAHQFVRLAAGAWYVIRFQYRTIELPDPTGVRWSMGESEEYDFRSSPEWTDAEWRWQASGDRGRLALAYRRKIGNHTPRGHGAGQGRPAATRSGSGAFLYGNSTGRRIADVGNDIYGAYQASELSFRSQRADSCHPGPSPS